MSKLHLKYFQPPSPNNSNLQFIYVQTRGKMTTFLYALLISSADAVCCNPSTSYNDLPDVLQTM